MFRTGAEWINDEENMAKQPSFVFVKYVPPPGGLDRVLIGNRFFSNDPKTQQGPLGDLIEVDFVRQYRDQLESMGCLIFDEAGVQKTVDEVVSKLRGPSKKEAAAAATAAAGHTAGAAKSVAQKLQEVKEEADE